MGRLGFIYHPDFLKHDTGIGHPERPQRLEALVQHLFSSPLWSQLSHLRPEPAALEWVHAIHPERYTSMIKNRCRLGEHVLDEGDTHISRDSVRSCVACGGCRAHGR